MSLIIIFILYLYYKYIMSFYSDNVEKMIIIRSITTIIYACIFLFIKYKQKNIPIYGCR